MSIKEFTPSSNFARIYQAFKSAPTTRPLKRRKRSKEDKYFFLDIDIDRKRSRVHAQDEKKESLNDGISERLKKAEQEAEQLRKQLAEAKALQAEVNLPVLLTFIAFLVLSFNGLSVLARYSLDSK